jgi:hypothetical protein
VHPSINSRQTEDRIDVPALIFNPAIRRNVMSTPPFEITGSKAGSPTEELKITPEKQLKEFLKIEKIEKIELKEKPEKIEHKEKPEKVEHKEKPEKFEHKEKPEKFEHKEKPEKIEHKEKIEFKEKLEFREKLEILENLPKTLAPEGPSDPGGPVEDPLRRLSKLEQTVGELQHFITANLRPDLSKGALKQEPDAGDKPRKA